MHLRRTLWIATLLTMLGLSAALAFGNGFACLWAREVLFPYFPKFSSFTQSLPFALLEWGVIALTALIVARCAVRAVRKGVLQSFALLLRQAATLLCAFIFAFCALWLPLYRIGPAPVYAATPAQLIASCEKLIAELNASELDFSILPSDLPAKAIHFPIWMRALKISGLYAFPTGEALISPTVANCAAPFVAVHEAMHARFIASEGAANIAAWEECMRRGGLYADSARLWALKYSMAALYEIDPQAYAQCRRQMRQNTFAAYRQMGGGRAAAPERDGATAVFAALGVSHAATDYEILSAYLASGMPQ